MASRMHVSVESKESPLNFNSGPCAVGGPLATRSVSPRPNTNKGEVADDKCFDAFNAPKPPTAIPAKDQLNLFNNDENVPPTGNAKGQIARRDPNACSTEEQQTHSKNVSGVKRIEVTIPADQPQSIKIVDGAPNRERTVTIVGEGAVNPTSPIPNRSVSPRPNSASAPMGAVLTMDKALINHTGAVDVVGKSVSRQRSASVPAGTKRSRDLSAAEKIVLDISTNIGARHGSVANFFFHLARGTVGHLGTLEQASGSKIPVATLREQLCVVANTEIDVPTFNAIFFADVADEAEIPQHVTFADFTKAFPDAR